jgi:anti-repressor protein
MPNLQPQTYKVNYPHGTLPLLVDVDGSRWLALALFADSMGIRLHSEIIPIINKREGYWGYKFIGGKLVLPCCKVNELMPKLHVYPEHGPALRWLANHGCETLRKFTIPEAQTPMLTVEPETVHVGFARPAPAFYAPAAPQELITIRAARIAGAEVNAVNARELYAFMDVKSRFDDWFRNRSEDFGFVEHQDFEVFLNSQENPNGGRPTKEYMISVSMAKELAMVERNAKGKEARLYFIECERKALTPQNPILTMSRLDLLKMAVESEEKVATLECKVTEQGETIAALEPKAEGFDLISSSDGSFSITMAAKQLQQEPKKFRVWLHEHKWIYRRVITTDHAGWKDAEVWLGFQDKLNSGLVKASTFPIYHKDGVQTLPQARITALGLTRLAKHFGAQIEVVA